jgi:hypothetical protein
VAYPYQQQKQGYSHNDKMMMQPGVYAFETIASLQNDENGNPTWIVSGHWKGSLLMDNKTQGGGGANQTTSIPTTANASAAATGNLPNAKFNSKFNMVMTNGSALHDHEIYDFRLTDMTMPNNSTMVYNGLQWNCYCNHETRTGAQHPCKYKVNGEQCHKHMG